MTNPIKPPANQQNNLHVSNDSLPSIDFDTAYQIMLQAHLRKQPNTILKISRNEEQNE